MGNSMIQDGPKSGSEMAAEKVGLVIKIGNLEEQIKVMELLSESQEGKYRDAYGRKDYYKAKAQELEEKMKMIKEDADSEKEKYTKENEIEKSKRLKQTVGTYAMEEALDETKKR